MRACGCPCFWGEDRAGRRPDRPRSSRFLSLAVLSARDLVSFLHSNHQHHQHHDFLRAIVLYEYFLFWIRDTRVLLPFTARVEFTERRTFALSTYQLHISTTMTLAARSVLGKRGCNKTAPPSPPTKRTRTRTHTKRPCHGLPTPEPSTLSDEPLAQKDIFPFMSLPAELRLHIYTMALVRVSPIPLHISRAPEKPSAERTTPARAVDASPAVPTDAIVPVILRLNQQIYKEARQLLYAENTFRLSLLSGIHTLSTLHQRSRSMIKHVVLSIPSHHDILDGFADLVRLGLRYCWGLKSFRIVLLASLPDDGRIGGATSVYANAFHILRWLPRGCSVVLEGCVSETVRKVVSEEGRLMSVLDEVSYYTYLAQGRWM